MINFLSELGLLEVVVAEGEEEGEYSSNLDGAYCVELRQGARWFDAQPYGELSWRLDDGLFLDNWSFGIRFRTKVLTPSFQLRHLKKQLFQKVIGACSLEELDLCGHGTQHMRMF